MDSDNLKLLRALFNAARLGKGVNVRDLADRVGVSEREVRERLDELEDEHLVRVTAARGADAATLLPSGEAALLGQHVVVNSGIVQIGDSNTQVVDWGDDRDEDVDDDESGGDDADDADVDEDDDEFDDE